jgi:hypothetical protein
MSALCALTYYPAAAGTFLRCRIEVGQSFSWTVEENNPDLFAFVAEESEGGHVSLLRRAGFARFSRCGEGCFLLLHLLADAIKLTLDVSLLLQQLLYSRHSIHDFLLG